MMRASPCMRQSSARCLSCNGSALNRFVGGRSMQPSPTQAGNALDRAAAQMEDRVLRGFELQSRILRQAEIEAAQDSAGDAMGDDDQLLARSGCGEKCGDAPAHGLIGFAVGGAEEPVVLRRAVERARRARLDVLVAEPGP